MPTIAETLAEILDTVSQPCEFCVADKIDLFAPRLEVDGVGTIALPLTEARAAQLVAVAEQAPFGRGEETLLDAGVRRTWQIAPDKVRIGGRHWDETLHVILDRFREGLGLTHPIAADFYSPLVRESEKPRGLRDHGAQPLAPCHRTSRKFHHGATEPRRISQEFNAITPWLRGPWFRGSVVTLSRKRVQRRRLDNGHVW